MSRRVLIACVGNVLRHDDGFGVAVARALESAPLPDGVDLIETGIGGMSIVQRLMDGYDALIVVEEAAKADFVAPQEFDELERRDYDDTVLIVLRRRG